MDERQTGAGARDAAAAPARGGAAPADGAGWARAALAAAVPWGRVARLATAGAARPPAAARLRAAVQAAAAPADAAALAAALDLPAATVAALHRSPGPDGDAPVLPADLAPRERAWGRAELAAAWGDAGAALPAAVAARLLELDELALLAALLGRAAGGGADVGAGAASAPAVTAADARALARAAGWPDGWGRACARLGVPRPLAAAALPDLVPAASTAHGRYVEAPLLGVVLAAWWRAADSAALAALPDEARLVPRAAAALLGVPAALLGAPGGRVDLVAARATADAAARAAAAHVARALERAAAHAARAAGAAPPDGAAPAGPRTWGPPAPDQPRAGVDPDWVAVPVALARAGLDERQLQHLAARDTALLRLAVLPGAAAHEERALEVDLAGIQRALVAPPGRALEGAGDAASTAPLGWGAPPRSGRRRLARLERELALLPVDGGGADAPRA